MKQFYLFDVAVHYYEKIPIFLSNKKYNYFEKEIKKKEINNQKKS